MSVNPRFVSAPPDARFAMPSAPPQESTVWKCVAGGVALGAALGFAAARALGHRRPRGFGLHPDGSAATAHASSAVWSEPGSYSHPEGTPAGFTLRTPVSNGGNNTNPTGVDVMMEKWDAGSAEPPHSHPGDDMTIVVQGRMSLQFFTRSHEDGGALRPDGPRVVLEEGDVGCVASRLATCTFSSSSTYSLAHPLLVATQVRGGQPHARRAVPRGVQAGLRP